MNIHADLQRARFIHGASSCKFATTGPIISAVHWYSAARLRRATYVIAGDGLPELAKLFWLGTMNDPLCWLCGTVADSAEHMVKASDFRALFPGVDQRNPVFRHTKDRSNLPIKGANAAALKFSPSLCQFCNNARTQPHDLAWALLSSTLQSTFLVPGARLPITRAFGSSARESMLHVHLYFLKLFGCYAVEHKIPLPTRDFAVAICSNLPHPNVHLGFVAVASNAARNDIFVGNIEAINRGNRTVSAVWFYILGAVGVHIAYWEPGHPRLHNYRGWNPSDVSLNIRLR